MKQLIAIRAVTAFVTIQSSDFPLDEETESSQLHDKIASCASVLRVLERTLVQAEYLVQTVRIATNPFGEWLVCNGCNYDKDEEKTLELVLSRLQLLHTILNQHGIEFCALGPAMTEWETLKICPEIIRSSPYFSCSANVDPGNVKQASAAAEVIFKISTMGDHLEDKDGENISTIRCDAACPNHIKGGLGNFRFCAAASCTPYIPFFPAAKAASVSTVTDGEDFKSIKIGLGLENGTLARHLFSQCSSIANLRSHVRHGMAEALDPIQEICRQVVSGQSNGPPVEYLGIDSSLNPSLDDMGSVAKAMEQLEEVTTFGGPGTLAAAAELTQALQTLPGIQLIGYCGLMLPLCEDTRLAQLASIKNSKTSTSGHDEHAMTFQDILPVLDERPITISDLLSISSVCGVGIDTVPIPGNTPHSQLAALILDVAGLAGRWNKSLSCRTFPVAGKQAGDWTTFDSPHMCNSRILSLDS